jgi:RNA polymerase sigma factor (sigma-70 family)
VFTVKPRNITYRGGSISWHGILHKMIDAFPRPWDHVSCPVRGGAGMPQSPLAAIVGRLMRGLPPTDVTSDAALLARFIGWRDEAAFELLVYRHGPMVRGLCRRVLRHEHDAEDAFQATFLALAKKAATIRGQFLAGWLYRVAFHAALKAKASSALRETDLHEISAQLVDVGDELHNHAVRAALDEEILRLPERFRLPVVLCYLQGRSNSEAAAALGIPKGTVDSRLATARQRLRVRLVRRGFAPAIAAAAFDGAVDAADLPGSVVRAVTKAAVAFISKQAGVPATAAVLAEGVLETMYLTKVKWAMAAAMTLALVGGGAGVATYGLAGDGPPVKAAGDKKKELPAEAEKPVAGGDTLAGANLTPHSASAVRQMLQQPAGLDKPLNNLPLRDALDMLSDKFGVTIRIDPAAFFRFGVEKPFEMYDQSVGLPVVRGMTLGEVLRDVLAQVRAPDSGQRAAFKVKGNQIVIVPAYIVPYARSAGSEEPILNPDIVEEQVQGEPISIEFKDKPLAEVLQDLTDATGANIVLDVRCREQGATQVAITLQNVRLLTALQVIADMANLQPVAVGNVYYVTEKQNADRLQKQEWPRDFGKARTAPKPAAPAKPGGM